MSHAVIEGTREAEDRTMLEMMRRGLMQEIEASLRSIDVAKEIVAGKRQQVRAIERRLGIPKSCDG